MRTQLTESGEVMWFHHFNSHVEWKFKSNYIHGVQTT